MERGSADYSQENLDTQEPDLSEFGRILNKIYPQASEGDFANISIQAKVACRQAINNIFSAYFCREDIVHAPRNLEIFKQKFGIGFDREMSYKELSERYNLNDNSTRYVVKNFLSAIQKLDGYDRLSDFISYRKESLLHVAWGLTCDYDAIQFFGIREYDDFKLSEDKYQRLLQTNLGAITFEQLGLSYEFRNTYGLTDNKIKLVYCNSVIPFLLSCEVIDFRPIHLEELTLSLRKLV